MTENPAGGAAGGGGEAGAVPSRGAGPGSVLGVVLSASTPTARGPEVADDISPRAAVGSPLSGRWQQRAVAGGSSGEARGQQQQRYASGVTREGESKRAASAASAQEVEMEMWKLGLQIGSKLDVKDTADKWCEASVVAVNREAAKVYVTYTYWAQKVCVRDELFSVDPKKIVIPDPFCTSRYRRIRVQKLFWVGPAMAVARPCLLTTRISHKFARLSRHVVRP